MKQRNSSPHLFLPQPAGIARYLRSALLGVFTRQPRVEPLGENTKRGGNMKNIAIAFFLCTLAAPVFAQQTPLFSVYRDQWGVLNPAALSNNYLLNKRTMSLSGGWHVQWWNMPESPRTQALSWEMVAEEQNSVFGAHLVNDRTGAFSQTGAYARYAYRINMGKRTAQSLSIGLSAGAVQYRADLSEIAFPDPGNVPVDNLRSIRPDFGVGVFYQYSDRYYAGVSVPQTLGFLTRFEQDGEAVAVRRAPHIFAVAGGYWSTPWLGNSTSFVEPSVWVKYAPNGPINLDLNLRAQISELVWAGTGANIGMGVQPGVALHFEAGLFFGEQVQLTNGQLKTGFAFDLPVTQGLGRVFGGSAEVVVVYAWR
ncbi:MAG: PorP/SprF family type IX secretion system membrane protein [Lewinellaceae bacterium]|nr:PorP/SprF family type IX secretion system membrane protein [Lewinellaceae bacterium]